MVLYMSSSSIHFTPGGRSQVKSLLNCNRSGTGTNILGDIREIEYKCPKTNNKKVLLSSNNDSTGTTTVQRQVNTILYVGGGRTTFGNQILNDNQIVTSSITFLGKREGQPGGIQGFLRTRNRF